MKELFQKRWAIMALIGSLLITLIIIGLIRQEPDVLIRSSRFEESPIVIICDDAPYNSEEVESAMKWWEDLGYDFETIFSDFPCGDGIIEGAITITLAEQETLYEISGPGTLALTKTIVSLETEYTLASRIQVLVTSDRVLEHELGHALGWYHVDTWGHMMHPDLNIGGWDSTGLEDQD